MNEPRWIAPEVIHAIHEAQLAEHGGRLGIRGQELLESALAQPKNLYAYSGPVSLNRIAAAYAFAIARSHVFIDGNKRTGWVACALFLELNGVSVVAKPEEVVAMMLRAAEGSITEGEFTAWLDEDHPGGQT